MNRSALVVHTQSKGDWCLYFIASYSHYTQKLHDILLWSRALRYYRIGIESPILLEKSIVSVSYQYRNSTTRKYQLSISIKNTIFKSISIVSVSLFLAKWYQVKYQWGFCTINLTAMVILKGFYSYEKLKIAQNPYFFGIIYGIIPFSWSIGIVSVSGFLDPWSIGIVSVSI